MKMSKIGKRITSFTRQFDSVRSDCYLQSQKLVPPYHNAMVSTSGHMRKTVKALDKRRLFNY